MPQFNKRGNRIRASDKSLVFRFSAGSLLLLFLAVVMLLNLKTIITTDWKVISLFQDGSVHLTVTPYRIMTIVLAALVCVLATLFYRRFQYDRVKHLFHRQKLARMLLENGWYESESTQDSGFFKDLPTTTKKEKITYFPKLYYRMEHGLLYIRTEITLGKYQDQLLHLEKKLETGLYCELVSKELKDSYVEYVLLYDTIANRITINEVQAEHGSLRLMKNVWWEYDKLPHMLIAGGTGGGKTYFTLTCILLAFFDWRLALCMYITLPVAFLIIWLSKNYQKKLFERQVQAKLDASSQVQEYLEGMKIIKSCNLSGSHFSALNKALLSMKKIAVKVEMICGVFMSSASMILQAGIGIVIFVGTMLLVKGEIELLPLLMFFLMVTRIYGPILAILSQLTTLLNLNVVTERMRTLLSTSVMQGNDKEIENCDIELEHVTFRYNTKDVIKDVTCKIPQGSITALVGSSGSGKSTISKLIARFWDIQKGTIRVGGKDIRTMEPESLMRKMAFVFQDVTLFNDTVFNNISIGNPNATEEEVMAAAKAAYCDEFVRNMPDGYQTVLGENGSTLSGGERQRISIARALLKNASIIFLDEATASLDPENEVLVQKAIAQLVENKTVIMIAHRLRTVVDADQILVLDDGKLVEYGTHNELMKKKGVYQKLYHIQQESLGWTI